MLSSVFEPFVEQSPISVMARGLMERVLNPDQLNEWFDRTAEEQYTKDLMFSSVFNLMSLVVLGSYRSVNTAYKDLKKDLGVSLASVYNKLNGIEPATSAELVSYAVEQVEPIIRDLGGTMPPLLPGKRIKLLDGNCIEKSQHRIKELRDVSSGPLPGKSLVVYDIERRLPIEVIPCEDGHVQERLLLKALYLSIEKDDVWIADRNFCTAGFTTLIDRKDGFFILREHKKYPYQLLGKEKYIGKIETGTVYEQSISVHDDNGKEHTFRRIRVKLNKKTRNGDTEICIISNLSKDAANAKTIALLYQDRWTIETAFQHLAQDLNSEINTLGYPRAALFGFCVALVAYIIMSVIKAALGSVHGADVIEQQLSGYYVSNEISTIYPGMKIAIKSDHWHVFHEMTDAKMVKVVRALAQKVELSKFKKNPRGPKKPKPKRKKLKNKPHVSTFKLLQQRNG